MGILLSLFCPLHMIRCGKKDLNDVKSICLPNINFFFIFFIKFLNYLWSSRLHLPRDIQSMRWYRDSMGELQLTLLLWEKVMMALYHSHGRPGYESLAPGWHSLLGSKPVYGRAHICSLSLSFKYLNKVKKKLSAGPICWSKKKG